jgi:Putative peptidoglycan binding domain
VQDRTGGRRAARVAPIDEGPAADGVVARIVERAIDNPAKTGGLFVMALTAATIVSNALLLQTGRHPGPLFITRPEAVATPAPVPLPRVRASQTDVAAPPIQAAPVAAPTPAKLALDTKPIKSLQSALAARGIYHGVVDGVLGSRTRAAISAYEKANGLPVTGEPSTLLLDTIEAQPLKAPSKPAAMAPAPTDTLVVGSTPPVPVPAPKVTPVTTVAVGPVAATGPVSVAMPAPEPQPDRLRTARGQW